MSNFLPSAATLLGAARDALAALAAGLLPQDCALCGRESGAEAVCSGCLEELPGHGESACPLCGDTSSGLAVCGHCLRQAPHFDRCLAAFEYRFPVDRLIHQLKYGGRLHLAPWWARRLELRLIAAANAERGGAADAPAARATDSGFDLLLSMPLHPSRLQERGFNQAGEIARLLARRLRLPYRMDACTRVRATPTQASLDRDQRLRNVRDAFECRADLSGKHVLLVDDVMTTGASLGELSRILKLHGASQVTACVGARAMSRA